MTENPARLWSAPDFFLPDLPVQAPTKYETAVNLKTAKALGLTILSSVLPVPTG